MAKDTSDFIARLFGADEPEKAKPESRQPEAPEGGEKRRKIMLPKSLDAKLDWLADRQDEVNGVLFYRWRKKGNVDGCCPVYHLYLTGQGSAGHVISDPKRLEVVNRFLELQPDFSFVKFHTHSNGTVEISDYFATHFSSADIDIYRRLMEDDPNYIGMVATPVTKLLFGRDDPELEIIDGLSEEASRTLSETSRKIKRALINIAKSKGYDPQFKLRI